jgi:hypothetical protein
VLDNRALTPEFLKSQIEKFSTDIKTTSTAWSFTR